MGNTKAETIKRFRAAVNKKFGEGAQFEHQEADPLDELEERIDVSVPVDKIDWSTVEPAVEVLLKDSGASRYFEIGGAGLGFGYRDVSLCRK